MTLDDAVTEAYLDRLGLSRPARADLDTLRTVQERHIRSVPFENVDIFRHRPMQLGRTAVEKIVDRHRGGGCYELNSSLSLLLDALGFEVEVLGGRIYDGADVTFPLRHLVLRVGTPEGPQLVDCGFGFGDARNSLAPLDLGDTGVQSDPHGDYRLVTTAGGDVDVVRNDRPLYRIEAHPRDLDEFSPTLWWFHTSPDSDFLQNLFCILPTSTGRLSLRNRRFSELVAGEKTTTELEDVNAVRAVLAERFGIEVDDIPEFEQPVEVVGASLAHQSATRGLTVRAA